VAGVGRPQPGGLIWTGRWPGRQLVSPRKATGCWPFTVPRSGSSAGRLFTFGKRGASRSPAGSEGGLFHLWLRLRFRQIGLRQSGWCRGATPRYSSTSWATSRNTGSGVYVTVVVSLAASR